MKKNSIKTSLLFTIIVLLLCYSSNVFAVSNYYTKDGYKIVVIGSELKLISATKGIFQYKITDRNGNDITNKILSSDIDAYANVYAPYINEEATSSAKTQVDPQTGTCTVIFHFDGSSKNVRIYLKAKSISCSYDTILYLSDLAPNVDKVVDKINFLSNVLKDTDENNAAFNYGIYNEFGLNITKDVPDSQIEAISTIYSITFSATTVDSTTSSATTVDSTTSSATTVDSTTPSATIITESSTTTTYSPVTLDPSSGRGTIKFNTPCDNKITTTTLVDKLTGKNSTLNTVGVGTSRVLKLSSTEVHRIDFTSDKLVKTASDTAKFKYKVMNHNFKNITDTIPESDIDAYAVIGTSKVKAILDPVNGEGTLNYNFSDTDKDALITITYKTGVTISEKLNIVNSESESVEGKDDEDLGVAKIEFIPTGPSIYYHVLNEYGRDITEDVPFSQIAASSSVNCTISLLDSSIIQRGTWKGFVISDNYKTYNDPNRTIIITLTDRLSGVKASLNIGASPKDTSKDMPEEKKADTAVVTFKDAVLEKDVRNAINKTEGDILISDIKNIADLSVDDGCEDLSGIENLIGLKSLQLCSSKISSLEPLRKLTKLQTLQYYTDSMVNLEPLEELENLTSLEVSCNQITTNDIQALGKLTSLRFLDVSDTKISGVGAGTLEMALPNCYIFN